MKRCLFILTMLAMITAGYSQSVTTHAGTQTLVPGGYNGTPNNTPLSTEKYSYPFGICVDTNSRMWVTDEHNMMLLDGATSRIRGGFMGDPNDPGAIGLDNSSGTVSRFYTPAGVAVNRKTNEVYICDYNNNVIRKGTAFVNTSNVNLWSTVAGKKAFLPAHTDGAYANAEFGSPVDIAITSTGVIYVSEDINSCIRKLASGTVSTIAGTAGTQGNKDANGTSALFDTPYGMFLESDNSLLVADRNNKNIRRINLSTGAVTTVVTKLQAPVDVVSVDGILYIADSCSIKTWDGTKLSVYAGSATASGYADGSGTSARFGELSLMTYRAADKSIYVADRENNVIRRITVTQPPVPDFVANNLNPTVAQSVKCTSKSKYTNSVVWSFTPTSYTLQGGSKLTDTVVYVSFNNTGAYSVTLTATNGTGSVPKTINNYINVSVVTSSKPAADFVANKTSTIIGDTVKFIDMSSNSPTQWDWTITPGTFNYSGGTSATSQNPRVNFTASGTYTVALKATNTAGNTTVSKTNYITIAVNGVKNTIPNQLVIFPNPANTNLHVSDLTSQDKLVAVGMNAAIYPLRSENNLVNISTLPDGVYQLICTTPLGIKKTARFVKIN